MTEMWLTLALLISLLPLPLISVWTTLTQTDLSGLRQVHLVFRHGDRTPIDPYPTDPYKDPSNWPVGFGQLTSRGKMQHFQLGQWIRARYQKFLSPDYSEDEVYVRSTDVDRTLMSASANLAGLFPPRGYQKFNPNLDWQPIPIHTLPQSEDSLLSSHAVCPRFSELLREVANSAFMKHLYNDNRDLFKYLSEHTGSNITDISHLDYIYDTLLIENIYNKTLPEWTKKVFPGGKFKELRDLSFTVNSFNHELKRLKGGPFIQELVDHFDVISQSNGSDGLSKKLYIYSGHDTTVAPILDTLGVFNGLAPPYCSMIIIELFERSGLHVRISYKNETNSVHELTLPGCQNICPVQTFKELTANVRPVDWRRECGLPQMGDPTVQRVTLLAAVVSSVLAFSVLVTTLALLCRSKRTDSISTARYQPVGQMEDF